MTNSFCAIHGTILSPGGIAYMQPAINFRLEEDLVVSGILYPAGDNKVKTAADGTFTALLPAPEDGVVLYTIIVVDGRRKRVYLGAGDDFELTSILGATTFRSAYSVNTGDPLFQALGPNLIPWGGMEVLRINQAWYPLYSTPVVAQSSDVRPGSPGTHSLQLTIGIGDTSGGMTAFTLIQQYHQYRISAWVKSIGLNYGVTIGLLGTGWSFLPEVRYNSVSADWTLIEFEYYCLLATPYLFVTTDGAPGQSGLIDDLAIQEVLLWHEVPSALPGSGADWNLVFEDHLEDIS